MIDNIFLSNNLGGKHYLSSLLQKEIIKICYKRSHYVKGLKSKKLLIFIVEMSLFN
jgi:hypothetical protein